MAIMRIKKVQEMQTLIAESRNNPKFENKINKLRHEIYYKIFPDIIKNNKIPEQVVDKEEDLKNEVSQLNRLVKENVVLKKEIRILIDEEKNKKIRKELKLRYQQVREQYDELIKTLNKKREEKKVKLNENC